MGQINIGGTSASVQLQGNNTITSDQAFTFPDTGGELGLASETVTQAAPGSSSGGREGYTKFDSGLLICWSSDIVGYADANTNTWGKIWTFPVPFIEQPAVQVSLRCSDESLEYFGSAMTKIPSVTNVYVYAKKLQVSGPMQIVGTAIGRWK